MSDMYNQNVPHHSAESQKIAEISKQGYQLLKENKISDAIDCFSGFCFLMKTTITPL